MKRIHLFFIAQVMICLQCFAQTNKFDVYTYQAPEHFTRSELPSRVQFNLTNNDTSFCTITLYKSQTSKADIKKEINSLWSGYVVKHLSKADKKPQRVLTGQVVEGWASTIAIGNFYQGKKKCVVMLNTMSKDGRTGFVVFAFSDKSFKGTIELFSKELHLNNDK